MPPFVYTRPLLWLLCFLAMPSAMAQKTDSTQFNHNISQDTAFNKNSRTFLAIPLVNNSPSIGLGAGAVAMYFFKFNKADTGSPPNLVNVYGIYSNTQSHLLFTSAKTYWNNDKNRLEFGYGNIGVNHDNTYTQDDGPNLHLVYRENRNMFFAQYSHVVYKKLYAGIFYYGAFTAYTFNNGTDEENAFTEEYFQTNNIDNNFISSVGINLQWDSRDYIYYPSHGMFASIRPKVFGAWLGSENNYTDTDFKITYYRQISSNKIIAAAVAGGFATGDVPFDGYQSYGLRNSLRGYSVGKYKGQQMIATQVELRWKIYKRWGMVAFAGTGRVAGNETEDALQQQWLPSAGAGARFMVSREKRINIRLDVAFGVDGNEGLYFGIMEAF